MYSENTVVYKDKFNWKDFLGRVIIVLLFIFLLMWLFPMPNIDKLEEKVDNLEDRVTILTDRIYAENLEKLTDVARNYFTVSKLPKEVNGKVTLTLDEMLKKKLILEFTDKDGNSCDRTKSYVEITRLEEEYEVKTVLTCGEVTDYVISYMDLECNLACNNQCTLVEKTPEVSVPTTTPSNPSKDPTPNKTTYTLYKHSKTTETGKWTDWSEWTTEEVEGDDIQKKVEYVGKKWISKPVYEYEHTKTVTVEGACTTQTVKGDCTTETVKGACTTEKVLVTPAKNKTCTRTYTTTENYCVEKERRYVIGTYYGRDCATCAVKLQYKYGTETYEDCSGTREVEKTETYDCSTSAVYKNEEKCESIVKTTCPPETTEQVCEKDTTKTETIWSSEEKVEGYTATGNKKQVADNGYYEYTKWVETIPEGYEKDQTRTLYRYRNYELTRNTEYKWSENSSLGDGWIFTGETKTYTK